MSQHGHESMAGFSKYGDIETADVSDEGGFGFVRAVPWKLSQIYGPPNLSSRGASRSALIWGDSRTAPTDGRVKLSVLRQFPLAGPARAQRPAPPSNESAKRSSFTRTDGSSPL